MFREMLSEQTRFKHVALLLIFGFGCFPGRNTDIYKQKYLNKKVMAHWGMDQNEHTSHSLNSLSHK